MGRYYLTNTVDSISVWQVATSDQPVYYDAAVASGTNANLTVNVPAGIASQVVAHWTGADLIGHNLWIGDYTMVLEVVSIGADVTIGIGHVTSVNSNGTGGGSGTTLSGASSAVGTQTLTGSRTSSFGFDARPGFAIRCANANMMTAQSLVLQANTASYVDVPWDTGGGPPPSAARRPVTTVCSQAVQRSFAW